MSLPGAPASSLAVLSVERVFLEPLKEKEKLPLNDPLPLPSNRISDSREVASLDRGKFGLCQGPDCGQCCLGDH